MSDFSNIEAFAASMQRLASAPDFTEGTGQAALDLVASKIAARAASQEGLDGKIADNRGAYGRRKRAKGFPVGKGLGGKGLGGTKMLDLDQIKGRRVITADSASMSPGTTAEAGKKAEWFQNGATGREGQPSGAEGQPERRWFGMTDQDKEEVRDIVGRGIDRDLKR